MVSGFVLISGRSPTCFSTGSNIFEKKRLHVSMLSVWQMRLQKKVLVMKIEIDRG